jgi:acetyltransferase-like isoleucine patch superfamily enzyme
VRFLNLFRELGVYINRQASNFGRYCLEQTLYLLIGWVPTIVGIGMRGLLYRSILNMDGWAAIEDGVRLRFANHIWLEQGAYIDKGVYLHASPMGIKIGANTMVMHGAILHVYNFRDLPNSVIRIGRDCLIGEYSIIRGQGGVEIGDRVYTSPYTQIISVNHVFDDPDRPFIEQGITAEGITIEDDVWLGAGSVITDGVTIGKGSVIAAGAVVTRNVAPGTVVGGVPAQFIRHVGAKKTNDGNPEIYFGGGRQSGGEQQSLDK